MTIMPFQSLLSMNKKMKNIFWKILETNRLEEKINMKTHTRTICLYTYIHTYKYMYHVYHTWNMHGSSYAIHGGHRCSGELCKWHTGSQAHTFVLLYINNMHIFAYSKRLHMHKCMP